MSEESNNKQFAANPAIVLKNIKKPDSPSLLYDIIKEMGITVTHIAKKTHVSRPTIHKLKKGKFIRYPYLKLIADFLEVTPEELAQ